MIYLIKCFTNNLKDCGETVYINNNEDSLQHYVLNNTCDIYECGSYPYVVTGYVEYGFYNPINEIQWYKWDEDIRKYKPIPRPNELQGKAFLI